jgi:ribosomal protein L7/L12
MSNNAEDEDLEERIRSLLAEGRKIEAIRLYRDATDASLAAAKEAVEALEQGRSLHLANKLDSEFRAELLALLQKGQKIEAIKLYRTRTGAGLKDAKDAVEALGLAHGLGADRSGCLAVLFPFLAGLLGWYLLMRP